MTLARELMTRVEPISDDATVAEAARRLAASTYDSIPVCDSQGRLRGLVSDRDLVVEVAAAGKLSSETRLIDLVRGEVVSVRADDTIEKVIETMRDYRTPRVPVVDGDHLVGMLSRADLAARVREGLLPASRDEADV
ncbi:MAG TPA: CBS domain-containing protein [Mycobacteriales bacterium]|nr:CBS domain-containing protein [Mycobacteriales bacterium]